jgi:hypothetical protein
MELRCEHNNRGRYSLIHLIVGPSSQIPIISNKPLVRISIISSGGNVEQATIWRTLMPSIPMFRPCADNRRIEHIVEAFIIL